MASVADRELARIVSHRRHALLTLAIVALTGCLATGCSFISSTLPPSAPDQRTSKAAANCGNIMYPVVDTASTIAGYSWILYANRKEEESSTKTYNVGWDGSTTLESQGAPTADYESVRILGYATMALFGASSVYGYYATLQCANLRREIAVRNRPAAAPPLAVLANPPKGIGGFTFDMTQKQAERACAANRQAWRVDGSVALCTPNVESNDARPVRLDFQAGELHRMTVIRRASNGELAKTYDELYAALRTTYGPPQVERAALVGPCSGALAECVKNGEKPKGPCGIGQRSPSSCNRFGKATKRCSKSATRIERMTVRRRALGAIAWEEETTNIRRAAGTDRSTRRASGFPGSQDF